MSKFKIGDEVECIENKSDIMLLTIGKIYIVDSVLDGDVISVVANDNMSHLFNEYKFKMSKNRKPKAPTHIVVWDEGCGDPAKFFSDKKEAHNFAKDLSEDTKNSNIKIAEVSNVKSVDVLKKLTFKDYKI